MDTHTYALLDFGSGERLEQWGPYRLRRPDPTAATMEPKHPALWSNADARYDGRKGEGRWVMTNTLPTHWETTFSDIALLTRLAPYKHTGIFPEQENNWQWMRKAGRLSNRSLHILNLFAYTGGATVALAKDGHRVTHVDSARPSIGWAKENALLNHIAPDRVRWILEDAPTFATKELKRGKCYDAIILDPPAYGHGTRGTTWRVQRDLALLLETCVQLLSETPAFIVLNGYAQHDMPASFHRLLTSILHTKAPKQHFRIEAGSLSLTATDCRTLDTGIVARVSFAEWNNEEL